MEMSNPELSQRKSEIRTFFKQVYVSFKLKRESDAFFEDFLGKLEPVTNRYNYYQQ